MAAIWFGFIGLGCVMLFGLGVAALRRWPIIGCAAIAIFVLIMWELPTPPPLATVVGVNVYALDVLSATFLLVSGLQITQLRRNLPGALGWLWAGLGLLLTVSLVSGLLSFEVGTAVNEFRAFLYPFATMTWALSLRWTPESTERLVEKFSFVLGVMLVVVCGIHVVLHGLGGASDFVDVTTGVTQTSRPLVSGQALVLLLCAVVTFARWNRTRKPLLFVFASLMTVCVLISQQRTVWAVGIAIAVTVFLIARSKERMALTLSLLVIAWGGLIVVMSGVIGPIGTTFQDSLTNEGTYDARVTSWVALLGQQVSSGAGAVLFGEPFGSGFGRFEGAGRWVTFAPHNWYVTVLLRVGVVGLGALLVVVAVTLARLTLARSRVLALVLAVAVTVYGWSYSWPWFCMLFLAWAISSSRPSEEVARARTPDLSVPRVTRPIATNEAADV